MPSKQTHTGNVAQPPKSGVSAEKQKRAAERKGLLSVPGVPVKTTTAEAATSEPIKGEAALRGAQAGQRLQADAIRVAVVEAFTSHNIDAAEVGESKARGADLLMIFKSQPQSEVKKALNAKESGYAKGSYYRVIISEANTCYSGYLTDAKATSDILGADVIDMPSGHKGYGWRARVDAIRRMIAGERHKQNLTKAFANELATQLAQNPDGDIFNADSAAVAKQNVEAKLAKAAAEAEAKRNDPREQGKAMADRIIKAVEAKFTEGQARTDYLASYKQAFDARIAEWATGMEMALKASIEAVNAKIAEQKAKEAKAA